jgi:hypothetical protein
LESDAGVSARAHLRRDAAPLKPIVG